MKGAKLHSGTQLLNISHSKLHIRKWSFSSPTLIKFSSKSHLSLKSNYLIGSTPFVPPLINKCKLQYEKGRWIHYYLFWAHKDLGYKHLVRIICKWGQPLIHNHDQKPSPPLHFIKCFHLMKLRPLSTSSPLFPIDKEDWSQILSGAMGLHCQIVTLTTTTTLSA